MKKKDQWRENLAEALELPTGSGFEGICIYSHREQPDKNRKLSLYSSL